MATQQKGSGRAHALKGEVVVHLEEASTAPAEAVYELLADIRSHLEWAGNRQPKKNFRLLSVQAPDGQASVGTEFQSTGIDPGGRWADSSVVTEASRPNLFEFVTESKLSTKKGKVAELTSVHRYELVRDGEGCLVSYTDRTVRISELPGAMALFKVPGLRALGLKMSGSFARKGLHNLVRMAEERSSTVPVAGSRDA